MRSSTGLAIIDQVSCHESVFSSSHVQLTIGSRAEIIFNARHPKVQSTKRLGFAYFAIIVFSLAFEQTILYFSEALVDRSMPITFKSADPRVAKIVPQRIIRADKGDTLLYIVAGNAGRTVITASLSNDSDWDSPYDALFSLN